jgi:hypothetical protein
VASEHQRDGAAAHATCRMVEEGDMHIGLPFVYLVERYVAQIKRKNI